MIYFNYQSFFFNVIIYKMIHRKSIILFDEKFLRIKKVKSIIFYFDALMAHNPIGVILKWVKILLIFGSILFLHKLGDWYRFKNQNFKLLKIHKLAVDASSSNIILGYSWIHHMRVVSSTLHIVLFPTRQGIMYKPKWAGWLIRHL